MKEKKNQLALPPYLQPLEAASYLGFDCKESERCLEAIAAKIVYGELEAVFYPITAKGVPCENLAGMDLDKLSFSENRLLAEQVMPITPCDYARITASSYSPFWFNVLEVDFAGQCWALLNELKIGIPVESGDDSQEVPEMECLTQNSAVPSRLVVPPHYFEYPELLTGLGCYFNDAENGGKEGWYYEALIGFSEGCSMDYSQFNTLVRITRESLTAGEKPNRGNRKMVRKIVEDSQSRKMEAMFVVLAHAKEASSKKAAAIELQERLNLGESTAYKYLNEIETIIERLTDSNDLEVADIVPSWLKKAK